MKLTTVISKTMSRGVAAAMSNMTEIGRDHSHGCDIMVARLKDKGRLELKSFKSRVLRQAALGRIAQTDANNLVGMVNELDAYVCRMDEKPNLERQAF